MPRCQYYSYLLYVYCILLMKKMYMIRNDYHGYRSYQMKEGIARAKHGSEQANKILYHDYSVARCSIKYIDHVGIQIIHFTLQRDNFSTGKMSLYLKSLSGLSKVLMRLTIQLKRRPYNALAMASLTSIAFSTVLGRIMVSPRVTTQ